MPTISQLENLLSLDPNDPFVHYGLGQEYAKLNEHKKAIECYDKAIELDPDYCYAYYFKAQSLDTLGQRDLGVVILDQGLEAARRANDEHAIAELMGLQDSMT